MSFSVPMAAANASGTDECPVFHRANADDASSDDEHGNRLSESRPPLGQPVERRRTRRHQPAHHVHVPLLNAVEHVDYRQTDGDRGDQQTDPIGMIGAIRRAASSKPPSGRPRDRRSGAARTVMARRSPPVEVADPPPPVPGSPPGVPVSTVVLPGCPWFGRRIDRPWRPRGPVPMRFRRAGILTRVTDRRHVTLASSEHAAGTEAEHHPAMAIIKPPQGHHRHVPLYISFGPASFPTRHALTTESM